MIRFLVMDVDGTLTDGKIYMGNHGELMKSFNIKDGCGIKDILPQYKITPIIITARSSNSLRLRCEELGIKHLYQNERNKLERLEMILQDFSKQDDQEYNFENVAYIGDDILDIPCMQHIKNQGGFVGCPLDAVPEVVKISDFISDNKGGDGAVRDFIEWLIGENGSKTDIEDKVEKALTYIKQLNLDEIELGKYHVGEDYYMVQEYQTMLKKEQVFESHKKYVDIQYIIKGKEKIKISDIKNLKLCTEYDETTDVMFWESSQRCMESTVTTGGYVVLYPENAHIPCISDGEIMSVKKLVYKVKI